MAETYSDIRQKEHIANLGKPISKPATSPLKPSEEVIDVEAVPVKTPRKPRIVATGGK